MRARDEPRPPQPSLALTIQLGDPLAVSPHEPLREQGTVLPLPRPWQQEEVSGDLAGAPGRAATTRPGRPVRDVDVVVAGDLLARRDVAPSHQVRRAPPVQLPRVRVAAVVQVT